MPTAPPDNLADFNPRVVDTLSPYCGDLGSLWMPAGTSNSYAEIGNLSFTNGYPEWPGNHFVGCVSVVTGWVNGDVTSQHTLENAAVQFSEHVIAVDKEFANGPLARFYPPMMTTWNTAELFTLGQWVGSCGKTFLTRQRGRKLWMMSAATVSHQANFFGLPVETSGQLWTGANTGERVMVGDIYATIDAAPLTTTTHYLHFGQSHDSIGKEFDAIFEYLSPNGSNTLENCWAQTPGPEIIFPPVIGHLYGVGNDSLYFVDDHTYSRDGCSSNFDAPNLIFQGLNWSEQAIDVREIVPYDSNRQGMAAGVDPNIEVPRTTPHYKTGRVPMADMYQREFDYDGNVLGFGHPGDYTAEEKSSHYPIRPAPIDTPWMVGRTPNHGSLVCGKFIWGQDDPGHVDSNPSNTFGQDFRIDPRPEEGFVVIEKDEGPPHFFEMTQPNVGRSVRGIEIFGETQTMECRGYDRLPANECRGPIDCVLWTKGALQRNDAFMRHAETARDDFWANPTAQNKFALPGLMADYNVTIKNPQILFNGTGELLGFIYMQNPDEAEIWLRRWRVDAEERYKSRNPPRYIPFDENFAADAPENADADWIIERHNILEPGWFPLSCCLTPFGDFCYVMLEPYPEDTPPFIPRLPDGTITQAGRRDRYWRVIRPGHFDITTRLPYQHIGKQLARIGTHNRTVPQPGLPVFWAPPVGDYDDIMYVPGTNIQSAWTRAHNPVGMKTNEHWLFLTNFPARMYGTIPTEAEPDPPEPRSFRVHDLDNTVDIRKPGESGYPELGGLPLNTPDPIVWDNIAHEWMIDLATGKIRVPWRMTPQGAIGRDQFFGGTHEPVDPIGVDSADIALNGQSTISWRPGCALFAWDSGALRSEFVSTEFKSRYRFSSANPYRAQSINTASQWDIVRYVEGFSPPPVDH